MLRTALVGVLSALLLLTLSLPAVATPNTYTVRAGDTLASIARAHNVPGGWQELHAANRTALPDPNRVEVGLILTLPATAVPVASVGAAPAPPPPPPPPPPSDRGAAVVAAARAQIGKPYVYGGTGPGGFDCSGLTGFAWRTVGVELPRVSRVQFANLSPVAPEDARPGDIVAFGNPVHHVGIYSGDGMMVHASRPGVPVAEVPVHSHGFRGYVRP